MGFFTKLIERLQSEGHHVDIACNSEESHIPRCFAAWDCQSFQIPWTRSIFDFNNVNAIKVFRRLLSEHQYSIMHCHTPIAAVCARIASKPYRQSGLKVVYTAHGFHFYKGAPLLNWALFYPIEKLCSRWTDVLITINKEDYELAKTKMKARLVAYIPGVGIDSSVFHPNLLDESQRDDLRSKIGVKPDERMILSVGELNKNKNHSFVIAALARLDTTNWRYVIAGEGAEKDALRLFANRQGVADRVILLGERDDVPLLCNAADLFVHASFREGLPVSLMEAMSVGIPCVASNIRGCRDLLDSSCLFEPDNPDSLICLLDGEIARCHIERNLLISERFNVQSINERMLNLYEEIIENDKG